MHIKNEYLLFLWLFAPFQYANHQQEKTKTLPQNSAIYGAGQNRPQNCCAHTAQGSRQDGFFAKNPIFIMKENA